jgi:hypothetical protein
VNFFDFKQIKERGDCTEYATRIYGAKIVNGRCAAIWRGGSNPESVSITKDEWYDHSQKVGGGIIELAAIEFDGNKQRAQSKLGDFYNLIPKLAKRPNPSIKSRYAELIALGYHEVKRYLYIDLNGNIRHITIRLEHETEPKTFCQGVPDDKGRIKWSLSGIETILYRLPEISKSTWVFICEGEKSADALAALGLPATTAAMGSGSWRTSYSESLRGKKVVICPDNDQAGTTHSTVVARSLYKIASQIYILPPDPSLPIKAGIDDWFALGHSKKELVDQVQALKPYSPPSVADNDNVSELDEETLRKAKDANAIPFRNFIPTETQTIKRGKPSSEITKEPRQPPDLIEDLRVRFLGFPRKVGEEQLFDHDRDTGRVVYFNEPNSLFAWIGRKSKKNPEWERSPNMMPQSQFYQNIVATAKRYESISVIPSWPRRTDVYYAHKALPAPCPSLSRLSGLLDFFRPATDEDYALMMAFVCAPLCYSPGIARPSWVIDSPDGPGSGKTSFVELVSQLYGGAPIATSKNEIARDMDKIRKRCVSRSGRNARIFLVDNVSGDFDSADFAYLVTTKDITGMAPYGHGEEQRPNDLVYVITSNSATLSHELGDRSLYIMVKKPPSTVKADSWRAAAQSYIETHRLEIISDIISMLEAHTPYEIELQTRFKEFESRILQPCCGSAAATQDVIEHIKTARINSNIEEEQAHAIREFFTAELDKLGVADQPCFIRTEVVNSWGRKALNDSSHPKIQGMPIQFIRNLGKSGLLKETKNDIQRVRRVRTDCTERHRGIGWNIEDERSEMRLIYKPANETEVFQKLIPGTVADWVG